MLRLRAKALKKLGSIFQVSRSSWPLNSTHLFLNLICMQISVTEWLSALLNCVFYLVGMTLTSGRFSSLAMFLTMWILCGFWCQQEPFAPKNSAAQTTGNNRGVNTSSTSNPKSPKFSPMFHTETSSPHQVSFPVFYYVYVFLLMPISQVKGRWIWCRYCTELEGLNWRIVNRFFVPSHSFIAGQWSRRLLIFQLVKCYLTKKIIKGPSQTGAS